MNEEKRGVRRSSTSLTVGPLDERSQILPSPSQGESVPLWGSARLAVINICFAALLMQFYVKFSLSLSMLCMAGAKKSTAMKVTINAQSIKCTRDS